MLPPIIDLPSPNHSARDGGTVIDMLVLHYTGMPSKKVALDRLTDPAAEVSAHYVVDEEGQVYGLVTEERRAWHAGIASWRGHSDVNNRSIGIEIVNPGHEFGYVPFSDMQMQSVIALVQPLLARHPTISPRNVLGHSDVAPWRKEDPGELFDWARLAAAGIGRFPSADSIAQAEPSKDPSLALRAIGYRVEGGDATLSKALIAFQRRYCPTQLTGDADSMTSRTLNAVLRLYGLA